MNIKKSIPAPGRTKPERTTSIGTNGLKWNGDFKEEFKAKNGGQEDVRLALEARRDLENNWIDAMRGQAPVHCNAELGCATMVAIKMAVESYRQRKTMLWDSQTEKVIVL